MAFPVSPASGFVASHAVWLASAVFAVFTAFAAGLVAWPAWRAEGGGPVARALLAASLAIFVVGIGGGAYLLVGTPKLAGRSLAAPESRGVPGLVTELARRMRARPNDIVGWTLLGRGYLSLNDSEQAAIAFHRASDLAAPQQKPALLSAYGEALTLAAGSVTPEAEAAFREALAGKPKDFAARFYLGQAYAERNDPARALEMWRNLLTDSPFNAPWRAELIDRIAKLQGQAGMAPDIRGMVAGLATRLRVRPDDLTGWRRLIRAYVVLGEQENARSALARAREAMKGRTKDLATLDGEARSLYLQK